MLVAAVCVLVVLLGLALLVVPVLGLWRQTKALSRTVADAADRIAAATAELAPPGTAPGVPARGTVGSTVSKPPGT